MIISKLQGGMGNQMFQYALGRHLSIIHGVPLALDVSSFSEIDPLIVKRSYDIDVFRVGAVVADPTEVARAKKRGIFSHPYRLIKEKSYPFDPEVLKAPASSYLDGYWQTERYFQDVAETIRSDFMLSAPLPQAVGRFAQKLAANDSVCINVRRGDFVNHPRNSAFHGTCDLEYFDAAVARIRTQIATPSFYYFSDDLDWCRENLVPRYGGEIVEHALAGERFEHYLHLISSCAHQIIPNSSFGWWGAWLNRNPDKIVIAPAKWTKAALDTRDLIPEGWVRL